MNPTEQKSKNGGIRIAGAIVGVIMAVIVVFGSGFAVGTATSNSTAMELRILREGSLEKIKSLELQVGALTKEIGDLKVEIAEFRGAKGKP